MQFKTVARTLLLLVIVLIVYASVYPLEFHPLAGPFLRVLVSTWRVQLHFFQPGDIVANVLLYVPFGLLTVFALPFEYSLLLRIGVSIVLAFVLSFGVEIIQLFDLNRVSSPLDIVANSTGALLGASIAALLQPHSKLKGHIAPLFLFGTWGMAAVLMVGSRHGPVSVVRIITIAAEALAAVVLALEILERTHLADRVMAAILLLTLVWNELAPFHFVTTAQHFNWIPFTGSLDASRGSGIAMLFEKVFLYGSTIWFLRRTAWSIWAASGVVAALLAVLEAAQVYLPSRTPEISDSILAILLGFVLSLLTGDSKKI